MNHWKQIEQTIVVCIIVYRIKVESCPLAQFRDLIVFCIVHFTRLWNLNMTRYCCYCDWWIKVAYHLPCESKHEIKSLYPAFIVNCIMQSSTDCQNQIQGTDEQKLISSFDQLGNYDVWRDQVCCQTLKACKKIWQQYFHFFITKFFTNCTSI